MSPPVPEGPATTDFTRTQVSPFSQPTPAAAGAGERSSRTLDAGEHGVTLGAAAESPRLRTRGEPKPGPTTVLDGPDTSIQLATGGSLDTGDIAQNRTHSRRLRQSQGTPSGRALNQDPRREGRRDPQRAWSTAVRAQRPILTRRSPSPPPPWPWRRGLFCHQFAKRSRRAPLSRGQGSLLLQGAGNGWTCMPGGSGGAPRQTLGVPIPIPILWPSALLKTGPRCTDAPTAMASPLTLRF